jgi:hypothetical protein
MGVMVDWQRVLQSIWDEESSIPVGGGLVQGVRVYME